MNRMNTPTGTTTGGTTGTGTDGTGPTRTRMNVNGNLANGINVTNGTNL